MNARSTRSLLVEGAAMFKWSRNGRRDFVSDLTMRAMEQDREVMDLVISAERRGMEAYGSGELSLAQAKRIAAEVRREVASYR